MRKYEDRYTKRPDGRYMTYINTGRYKVDGKPERIPIYANSSRELEQMVSDIRHQQKNGVYIKPTNVTVAEYARNWFKTYKSAKSIATRAIYNNVIEKHIIPSVGFIRLKELTRTDCQMMINDRFDHYETCNKIALTMKQIQKAAKKERIITDDFWDEIEMPKKKKSKSRILTDLEKQAIKNADFSAADKAFVYLLYGCGIRGEEIRALTVSDIDLVKHEVNIDKVVVFDQNKPVLENRAKSYDGIRTIPIPNSIYPIIEAYVKELSSKEKDPDKLQQMLLFTDKFGHMISKSAYHRTWMRILNAMNAAVATEDNPQPIQGLTPHMLRHNYATLLYYSGISELKAVELMGHADGKMIREVYAHLDEQKENTVSKLNKTIII